MASFYIAFVLMFPALPFPHNAALRHDTLIHKLAKSEFNFKEKN